MAVTDIVIFDNSGSMSGSPIEAALDHARRRFPNETQWRVSEGGRLVGGRLGDPDALDRICGWMGPSTLGPAISAVMAPGVRITVYTDEGMAFGGDDPLDLLDVVGGNVALVDLWREDADHEDEIGKSRRAHPGIVFEAVRKQRA